MNIYIQIIRELSHQNKYLEWYVNIIERALSRASTRQDAKKLFSYCEKHHIVPECFFKERKRKGPKGFLDGDAEHFDNFVYLTGKEHIFCHIFLTKMIKDKQGKFKICCALDRLLNTRSGDKISPKLYQSLKITISKNRPPKSEECKRKTIQTNLERYGCEYVSQVPAFKKKARKNKHERYGDETYNNREKAKETNLEKYNTEFSICADQTKEKTRNTKQERYGDENYNNREKAKETWIELYGVDNPNKSSEIREKTTQTNLERYGVINPSQRQDVKEKITKTWQEKEYIRCPHCNTESKSMSTMQQWHFDNCKLNPNNIQELHKCPHCDTTSTSLRILKVHHFDNCPTIKEKEIIKCPHCDVTSTNEQILRMWHFDNCPKNPENNKGLVCTHCGFASNSEAKMKRKHFDKCVENPENSHRVITCPHCGTKGFNKRNMTLYHFDNCKMSKVKVL